LRTMGKDWYLILHCHQVIPSSFHQNIFPSTPHFDSISDQAKVMYTNGTQCLNWVCHDLMNVIAQKKDLWKYSINLLKKKGVDVLICYLFSRAKTLNNFLRENPIIDPDKLIRHF
jgi:hypothetical protein